MTRLLSIERLLLLYQYMMEQAGGLSGLRDRGLLEAALAQPQMTFDGEDLYPTLAEKAAALGFALIKNHPFLDGNKRIGHAGMAAFLALNGAKIQATVEDQELLILGVAASSVSRDQLAAWLDDHIVAR